MIDTVLPVLRIVHGGISTHRAGIKMSFNLTVHVREYIRTPQNC